MYHACGDFFNHFNSLHSFDFIRFRLTIKHLSVSMSSLLLSFFILFHLSTFGYGYFHLLQRSTSVVASSTSTLEARAGSDRAFVGDTSADQYPSSVLVVGATGRVGKEVVRKLSSSSPPCIVKCLVRDLNTQDAADLASLPNTELHKGCVEDIDSLVQASKGCQVVVDVHGMKPPRFTKFPYDLLVHPSRDVTHPYNVNYLGTKRVLAAMKVNEIKKLVRITGSLTGKSAWLLLTIMFNLLLSMSPKWHERSEMAIRESGVDYTVIRPTGIVAEPAAVESQRSLIMLQGDTKLRPPKGANKISIADLSQLIFKATNLRCLSKTSVVVSSRLGTDGIQGWSEAVIGAMVPDYATMRPHRHALAVSLVGGSFFAGLILAGRYMFSALKALLKRWL